MKILQILPALEMGGVERGTIEIARALTEAGIPNAVASSGGPMVRQLEKIGVKHYTLPLASKNPFVMRSNAKKLARLAKDEGITLMHVRSRAPAWSVYWASKKCAVPWISTYHGVYGTKPAFLKLPYNRIMLKGKCTICVSDFVLNHVRETYGAEASKLVRIWRGADTEVFNREDLSEESVRAKKCDYYNLREKNPVILFPGRLSPIKGQVIFLEALQLMRHKNLGVIFLGSDQGRTEYSDYLRELASKLPDETQVVFRKHSKEIQKVYALSDIVVNATYSHPEAFGRTIVEAQAMGCVVVAAAHGGAIETIDDGKTGFLVPPGDAQALAQKLDALLDLDESKRKEIGAAATESVRNNFSIRKMCEETINLYKKINE